MAIVIKAAQSAVAATGWDSNVTSETNTEKPIADLGTYTSVTLDATILGDVQVEGVSSAGVDLKLYVGDGKLWAVYDGTGQNTVTAKDGYKLLGTVKVVGGSATGAITKVTSADFSSAETAVNVVANDADLATFKLENSASHFADNIFVETAQTTGTIENFGLGGDKLVIGAGQSATLAATELGESDSATIIGSKSATEESAGASVSVGGGSKLTANLSSATSTGDLTWTMGSGDSIKSGIVAGNVKFTSDTNAVNELDLNITSGSVVYDGSADEKHNNLSVEVTSGTFFINSNATTTKYDSIVSAKATDTKGFIALGDGANNTSLVAGNGSSIENFTVAGGSLGALEADAAKASITLVDASITKNASIDISKLNKNDASLDIDSIADGITLTHTLSNSVSSRVTLGSGTGTLNAENGTASISLTGGTNVVLSGTGTDAIGVSSENEKITDWEIAGVAGAVDITGSDDADEVSLAITGAVTGDINFGKGNDTITLTAVAGSGSIEGGDGNDVFDLSALPNTGANTVVVSDMGDVTKRGAANQTGLGADVVKLDKALTKTQLNNITLTDEKDGTVSTIIRGVKFNLGKSDDAATDTKYIIVNDGTSSSIVAIGVGGATVVGAYDASDTTAASYNTVDTESTNINVNEDDASTSASSEETDATATSAADINKVFDAMETAQVERKFLHVNADTNVDGTVKMGANPTNYLIMNKNASGSLTVDLGGSDAVVGLVDNSADLSKMEINNWNSTKDTLVVGDIDLSNYIKASSGANDLVNSETGYYGDAIVKKAGTFGATQKSGLWQTRFREGNTNAAGDKLVSTNYEVMLAVGSSEAAVADFTKTTTPVVALLDKNNVKDAVKGSAQNDYIVGGSGDSLDGGKGDDNIYATKSVVRIATLGEGNDTVHNVTSDLEYETFVMADSKDAKDLTLKKFETNKSGNYDITLGDGSSTGTSKLLTSANSDDYVLTKIKDSDGTYNTFIANTGTDVKVQIDEDSQQDDYDLYVGVKDATGTLDFGDLTKKNIFLGHSANAGEEWGDKSMYSNIRNVKSSSVGQSLLFGGSNKEVTLTAGGADDSLWGGGYGKKDLLVGNANYRTNFGTTNGSGQDTVDAFSYGANAAEDGAITDVVYFVDGVNYINVNNRQLIVGSSKADNLTFINAQKSATKEINFALGLGGQIFTALADLTENGSANMAFDANDQLYLGQGSKSTVTFSDEEVVKFGFDSQYNGMNVGNLNAKGAAAGSMINGQANMDQSIVGSANGASSICGGFSDGFVDGGKDTLVGGGEGVTTFFVGKDMGNDVITNVTDGDTIVFLNTKVSDITFSIDSDKNATAKVAGGATISVKANDSVKFADTSKITAQFTDGTYVFNGATWEPQANA